MSGETPELLLFSTNNVYIICRDTKFESIFPADRKLAARLSFEKSDPQETATGGSEVHTAVFV